MGLSRQGDPEGWLASTRLVVCVGAGGVGKTTVAASIALHAALSGRRAAVLTIDPARRLANSLGLDGLQGEAHPIDLSGLEVAPGGELWAAMLDSQSTFDRLIARLAPSEEARDRIYANHVYQHMSSTFAGSQDYMATERLHDLVEGDEYDLVVLDTPPVKNALDFLESPGRVVNFLDERVLDWFLKPYEPEHVFGRRFLLGTSAVVFRLLSYVFGRDFLDDLASFFIDFRGLYDGFRERHGRIQRLLRADSTSFLTVCAPSASSIDVARFFQEELRARRLPRGGLVFNQVHTCDGDHHDARSALEGAVEQLDDLDPRVRASVLARLGMAHRRLSERSQADTAMVTDLVANLERRYLLSGFWVTLPRLDGNVHDLGALAVVARAIFGEGNGTSTIEEEPG